MTTPQTEVAKPSGFIFIQSVLSFDCEIPFKLTDRLSVCQASRTEIARIQEHLKRLQSFTWISCMKRYESDFAYSKEGTTIRQFVVPRPMEDWRYFVVRFDGANDESYELEIAMLLPKNDIFLGWAFLNWPLGISGHQSPTFQFYNDYRDIHQFPRGVTGSDLENVARYLELIKKAEADSSSVFEACKEFSNLRHLPYDSNLQVLSCFSIIESLLTHLPNDKEIGDSLTHQLKAKLALLERFFSRPLDFSVFGVQNDDEKQKKKIWGELYTYRSHIAHGNRFKFDKKFELLKSRDIALDFLREMTKLVLIVALEQPDFIEDLKAV